MNRRPRQDGVQAPNDLAARQDLVKEPKTQGNGTVRKQSIQQTKKLQRGVGAEHNTRKTQNGKNLSHAEVSQAGRPVHCLVGLETTTTTTCV